MHVGKGSINIEDPAPRDFPPGTAVRATGQEDEWTMDENGRMLLNGIPTNIHSEQRSSTPRDIEVFQTPPPTPRQQPLDVEDEGVIPLNRILPLDPTYEDLTDRLPCGKPRPPHDFDQDVLTEESPLNQWLLDGSSRRSHHHLEASLPILSKAYTNSLRVERKGYDSQTT